MQIQKTSILDSNQRAELRSIWNNSYPAVIQHQDASSFDAYLNSLEQPNHILAIDSTNGVIAWAAHFQRNHETWFLLIVYPEFQGKRLGSRLLDELKSTNETLNGWVVTTSELIRLDGEMYPSPLLFYLKNGFTLNSQQMVSEYMRTTRIEWSKNKPNRYSDGLESERLTTRFIEQEDVQWWSDHFLSNAEATKYFGLDSTKSTAIHAQEWIDRQIHRYKNGTFGHQVLIEKKTGRRIGQAGLLLQEVENDFSIEIGYHIVPEFWGHGFAPEAANMFRLECFKRSWSNEVISMIDKGNEKSMRVAEKNDFVRKTSCHWKGFDIVIFSSVNGNAF